jgi:hypothetical protein
MAAGDGIFAASFPAADNQNTDLVVLGPEPTKTMQTQHHPSVFFQCTTQTQNLMTWALHASTALAAVQFATPARGP